TLPMSPSVAPIVRLSRSRALTSMEASFPPRSLQSACRRRPASPTEPSPPTRHPEPPLHPATRITPGDGEATMLKLGYKLCSEEHRPADLVGFAVRAEQAGFEFAMISDHDHPWTDRQGQSPFVWTVHGW